MNLTPPSLNVGSIGPGTRLGRYEILVPVAQGGMARVWAAKQHGQRGFSKVVAIKTILPHLACDPQFESMFLDEARVAAGVHHPNVCEIFDLGEEEGVLYLAMEWVEGESLARILKPGSGVEGALPQRMNARMAAKVIAEAAGGLHAAHDLCDDMGQRLNVVHRDISPQNILVGVNGAVKVMDFGVAKALGGMSDATVVGQVKGKAAYMSPEQAQGNPVDRRADVFALGICLYEATTGKRPFSTHGGNQIATIKKVISGSFDPPSAHVPGYPRDLEAIVLQAMQADPFRRFATADRMKTALEEWLAPSGPVITQTGIGQEVRQRVAHIIDPRQAAIKQAMRRGVDSGRASFSGLEASKTSDPSKLSEPSSASHRAISSGVHRPVPTPAATSAGQTSTMGTALMGVGIGLGAFVVIGGLGVAGYYVARDDPGAAAAAAAPTTPATTPAATPTTQVAAPAVAPHGYISLRAVPNTAVRYFLDDKPLASGVQKIERPAPGVTRILHARAEGFAEQKISLDNETPDKIDIILSETAMNLDGVPDPAPTAEKPKTGGTPKAAGKTAAPKPTAKPPPKKVDIPDNPFD